MATILIVDDDKFTRNVLETVFKQDRAFSKLNLKVVTANDGEEGLAAYRAHAPALVITDLLMPRLDGFGLCKAIRAEPGGKDTRILVSSAVYRDASVAQRLRAEYDAKFYAKPYQIKELTHAAAEILGAPRPTGRAPTAPLGVPTVQANTGRLEHKSLAQLLLELLDKRASGKLTVTRGKAIKTIDLVLGHPVAASSNLRDETLGYYLVGEGAITDAQHQQALEAAASTNAKLGAVLVSSGVLSSGELVSLLAAQTRHRIVRALRWPDGEYQFAPGPEPSHAGEPLDTEQLVLDGLRRTATADGAHKRALDLSGARLHLNDRGKKLLPRLPKLLGGNFGMVFADGASVDSMVKAGGDRRTIEIAVDALFCAGLMHASKPVVAATTSQRQPPKRKPSEDVPSVTMLSEHSVVSRLPRLEDDPEDGLFGVLFGEDEHTRTGAAPIELTERQDAVPGSRADPRESGVIDVSDIDLPPRRESRSEADQAKRMLLEEYLRVQGLDHYEILNIDRAASPALISSAVVEKRSKFSLEWFSRFDLGRDYAKVEDLHRRYELARETLLDDKKRVAYDQELAGGDIGPSAPSMDAEIAFRAARGLLERNDYARAIDKLNTAVELSPDEADYHAELGWAMFCGGERSPAAADAARPHLNAALQLNPDHAPAHEYKGVITATLRTGDVEAIHHLERALHLDPNRPNALACLERCRHERGELRPLERQYRKMLHRATAHTPTLELALWRKLGTLYRELDDLDSAKVALQSALRLAPDDSELQTALDDLGTGRADTDSERLATVRESWRADPLNPQPGLELVEAASRSKRFDAAFLAASTLVARGQADDAATELYNRYRPRFVVRAQRCFEDADWALVRHGADDPETGMLFDSLAGPINDVEPLTYEDLEIDSMTEVPEEDLPEEFTRMRTYVAHLLGVGEPRVHVRSDFGHQIHIGALPTPVLLVGDDVLGAPERLELAFRLGRAMTFLQPGRAVGGSRPGRMLKAAMLAAITSAANNAVPVDDPTGLVAALRDRVDAMQEGPRHYVHELVQHIARRSRSINLSKWSRALARTADRVGLVLCGDVPAAARFARDSGTDATDDLLDFALTAELTSLRVNLGLSIDV